MIYNWRRGCDLVCARCTMPCLLAQPVLRACRWNVVSTRVRYQLLAPSERKLRERFCYALAAAVVAGSFRDCAVLDHRQDRWGHYHSVLFWTGRGFGRFGGAR